MRLKGYWQQHPLLRHVSILLSGTVLAQAIPLLVSPLLTRLYTPAEFGLLTLYLAVVNGLLTVACWRYELTIVMAKTDAEARSLLRLCGRISLISCALFCLLLSVGAEAMAAWLRSPALAPWLWLAAVHVLLLALLQSAVYWLTRRRQYGLISRNKVAQSSGTAAAQIGLGLVPALGVTGLVAGTLIGHAAAAWPLWRHVRPELARGRLDRRRQWVLLKRYRRMPLLNGPNALVDAVRLNGIPLMLGYGFSQALLGQFALAWRLLQAPVSLVNSAVSQVLFQQMAAADPPALRRLLRRSLLILALAGALPFTGLYLLAPTVFPWLFGAQWQLAGDLARVLTPWLYLNFITSPLSGFFLITQRQLPLLLFSLAYAATPLLLIYHSEQDLLGTLQRVSVGMSLLLLVFIGMLWLLGNRRAT